MGNAPTFPAHSACCSWHYWSYPLCQHPWTSSAFCQVWSLGGSHATLTLTATAHLLLGLNLTQAVRWPSACWEHITTTWDHTHSRTSLALPPFLFSPPKRMRADCEKPVGTAASFWFLFPLRSKGVCGAVKCSTQDCQIKLTSLTPVMLWLWRILI